MAGGMKIVWILPLLRWVVLKQRNCYQGMAMLAEYAPIFFHAVVPSPIERYAASGVGAGYPYWTNSILFSLGVKKPQRLRLPTK